MKYNSKTILFTLFLLSIFLCSFAQDACIPVGWATQNGEVTGGGNGAVTVVSTYSALKTAITSSAIKVVHISGTITIPSNGKISFQDQSNKTIIGLPGAKLISLDLTAGGSGILYVKRCTNIIIRNVIFEGPGAYDIDGNDNMTIENCTRVWVDHCEFQDGMDGNLDIKTASDFVSVTWCKFIYNKAPIAGGSGGANDHRFSNLLGSSDDALEDRTKLNITFQYCWWAQGCRARMPRVRFGKVHLVNNYFNSTAAAQCIQAGFEANLLIESNVFENVRTPIDLMANNFTAITAQNNIFTNTTGNTAGSGTAFTPPYSIDITPAANVKSIVSNAFCGAGATMRSPTTCGCGVYALTTNVLPTNSGTVVKNPDAALYAPDSVVTITATPLAGYEFVNWSGDVAGNNAITTLTMTSNKNVTANFQQIVSPTLSALATQPSYPGTTKPYLSITSGSGKTSYVSGVINDPTDAAATKGIVFSISSTSAVLQATSSNTTVVPLNNIIITQSPGNIIVKIIPASVGYTTINLVASNTAGNSSTYKINYAASVASANPVNTIFHYNSSDASGASMVDGNYMFVADDENNFIRLYNRHNSGKELYAIDISSAVNASGECDVEGSSSSVKYNPGKRLYWIGSLGNNKSGDLQADRNRVIATEVIGDSANATLTVKSYSNQFRNALINWGNAQAWNFTASAASGKIPKSIDGFNVEGLSVTQGGDTAYIGFRAPCVPVKGTTPTATNRKYAVVAPVINFETIMNGNGQVSTTPTIGEPILFDFDGLGIRSIERVGLGKYLILAGLYTGGGRPAIYLWDGIVPAYPGLTPISTNSPVSKLIQLNLAGLNNLVQVSSDGSVDGHPEAMITTIENNQLKITLISDNGTIDYYNDGKEAKSLTQDAFKKFRSDLFSCPIDTIAPAIYLCPGTTSTSISSNLTGSNYRWQRDTCGTGNCFVNIIDDNNFSGTNTKILQINNISTNWSGHIFRCITDAANSNEYSIKFSLNWTGAIDNNWETLGNWDCNQLPDANTDVFINSGVPVLNSTTTIKSLQINKDAALTISAGNHLTVRQ